MRVVPMLFGLVLMAGCLQTNPPPPAGPADMESPSMDSALLTLGHCQGTISRYVVDVAAIRPFVHPAFQLYEGTDAQALPGSGKTLISVSAYECHVAGDAPAGPRGLAFIFARVGVPPGIDATPPMSYVARIYADEPLAAFLGAHGVTAPVAKVSVNFASPATWEGRIDAGANGTYASTLAFDPFGVQDTSQSGPFLAVAANDTAVTWLTANINVTARTAQGSGAGQGGDLAAFTGSAPPAQGAIVNPLDFPIVMQTRPWDGQRVPPPPPPST